jgi:hypothetical protein
VAGREQQAVARGARLLLQAGGGLLAGPAHGAVIDTELGGEALHAEGFGARLRPQTVVDGYGVKLGGKPMPLSPAREEVQKGGGIRATGNRDEERAFVEEIGEKVVGLDVADRLCIPRILSSGHASVPARPLASR